MPNWCKNKLTIVGPEADVAALVKRAHGPVQHYDSSKQYIEVERGDEIPRNDVLSFHQLVPIPDHIMAGQYDPHGYSTERKLWGCKWGASDTELVLHDGSRATYTFDTAWCPPITFFKKVSTMYPNLTLYVSFAEESPSRGRMKYNNGVEEIIADHYGTCEEDPHPEWDDNLSEDENYERYDVWEYKYYKSHDEWV